jgi:carboxyl-terminal processing protease
VANRLIGIGIVINFDESPPSVRSVMKGGPAAAAGVAPCDRIIAVDGKATEGVSIDDVVNRILGQPDTEVWVTFQRDAPALREVVMVRAPIQIPSVESRVLDGGVGFIRILAFGKGTAGEVERAIDDLRKRGATSWILDLRGNPGGLLSQAVETASLFVPSGPLVTVVGERGQERETKQARRAPGRSAEEGPLTVLISADSASAAEVLVGALQNRNRAVVLGRTSFGKGSVQVLFDFADGSELKLTVAHYETPGGISLQSRGIVPDVELIPIPAPRPDRVRLTEVDPLHEAELERAFQARGAAVANAPDVTLRYVCGTPDHEEEVRIARELLLEIRSEAGASASRPAALARAAAFLESRRADEEERLVRVLGRAGVDWSSAASSKKAGVTVRCAQRAGTRRESVDPQDDRERVTIDCEAHNAGDGDAVRLSGRAAALALDFPAEEIVVGRLAAGAKRTIAVEGRIARDPGARVTYVPFTFTELGGSEVECAPVRIETPARPPATRRPTAAGPAVLIAEAPRETADSSYGLQAQVRDPGEVGAAWVRVSNRSSKVDHKKVAFLGPAAAGSLDLSVDVPLSPGTNAIEICARNRDATRCETTFVFRTSPPAVAARP